MRIETIKNAAQTVWKFLCKHYIAIRTYFNDGSFVVQFFPFLMHPIIRNSYFYFIRFFGILASFCGVYYFLTEIISILFTNVTLSAFTEYTTLELLLPNGTKIDEQPNRIISPLADVMNGMFAVQGVCFILIYLFAITAISEKKLHLLGILAALFFSVGMLIISSTKGGNFTDGGLQNLGMTIAVICGNLSILLAGLDIGHHDLDKFKRFSIICGTVGIISTLAAYLLANAFTPLLERIGIYSIMLWLVLSGFAVMKRLQHPGVYKEPIKQ